VVKINTGFCKCPDNFDWILTEKILSENLEKIGKKINRRHSLISPTAQKSQENLRKNNP